MNAVPVRRIGDTPVRPATPWEELVARVTSVGGAVMRSTFENGQSVTITLGNLTRTFTAEWGELPAAEDALNWVKGHRDDPA